MVTTKLETRGTHHYHHHQVLETLDLQKVSFTFSYLRRKKSVTKRGVREQAASPSEHTLTSAGNSYRTLAGEGLDLPEVGVGEKESLRK